MKLTVNVTYDITPQRISDLFASAFEGGINYWAQDAELTATAAPMRSDLVWWGCPEHFEGPFVFELHYDDPDDDEGEGNGKGVKVIDNAAVIRGFEVMAARAPRHFSNFITDDEDAETADVFVQCIVFADRDEPLIYG
jgi:hypothetical protein